MAGSNMPYIGSKISLITISEIRYEGILVNVNTQDSTVTLSDVCMFGTENRKAQNFVLPSNEIYDYVVFNGKDIKDLTVCEAAISVEEDPAVVAVQMPKHRQQRQGGILGDMTMNAKRKMFGARGMDEQGFIVGGAYVGGGHHPGGMTTGMQGRPYMMQGRGGGLMGNNRFPRGGRGSGMGGRGRGGYHYSYNRDSSQVVGELFVDTSKKADELMKEVAVMFNFDEGNSKFDKKIVESQVEAKSSIAYSKTSFFDSLSCETLDRKSGRTVVVDREKQREVDTETFGTSVSNFSSRGPRYFRRRFRRPDNRGFNNYL